MDNHLVENGITLTADKRIQRIAWWGFAIRAVVLIILLSLKDQMAPYFISDDIAYEETAKYYMRNAKSAIDISLLNTILKGYMQPFWPIVMCVSAKMFGTLYMGRVINICLSAASIPVVYRTVRLLSDNEKTALLAGKLFAFLPITILTGCFPIKDIYLTWATLYAFYIFLRIYQKEKVGVLRIVLCVAAMAGIYFTRGAVVELLLIFFAVLWMDSLRKKKRYKALLGVMILVVAAIALFGANVQEAFKVKLEDYGGYNEVSDGTLSNLQMKSIGEFYKLPFAYMFATLQPMTLDYFAGGGNTWMRIMSLSNITIYPVAIANAVYIFRKKHNTLYWLCGVVIYCAIISMCLGIFRHYLFLLPLEIINCALCFDREKKGIKEIVAIGTCLLLLIVAVLSIM